MASRQNLNNRTDAFKPTGKRGILGKVYGALGKEFKQSTAHSGRSSSSDVRSRPSRSNSPRPSLGGEAFATILKLASTATKCLVRSAGLRLLSKSRSHRTSGTTCDGLRSSSGERQLHRHRRSRRSHRDLGTSNATSQYSTSSAIATEEQIPGQSTPLPPPTTHSNISNRLARNRVTANQPTEDIPPDSPSPRSRGMGRRR
jgi:hypothetical protein